MFISQAHAQAGTPPPAGGEWFLPIMMIGLLVFVLRNHQAAAQAPKGARGACELLGQGDEVLMSSGLMGKIVDLTDLYVVVNVSDRVDLKFQRTHVTATLPKGTIKNLGA